MKISLFIPIYNARHLIERNLQLAHAELSRLTPDFEIIFIDDNSIDKTNNLETTISKTAKASYVRYNQGPSRRENLARSFAMAQGEIICFIDADFSTDISYLTEAIETLRKTDADIVIGSRYAPGAKAHREPLRRIISFFYNLTMHLLFGSTILDHQCGLKVFKAQSLLALVKEMGFDLSFTRGWFWDAELLIRAQKKGLRIIEMPLEWHYADKSTFNLRREIRCIYYIYKFKKKSGF